MPHIFHLPSSTSLSEYPYSCAVGWGVGVVVWSLWCHRTCSENVESEPEPSVKLVKSGRYAVFCISLGKGLPRGM